MQFWKISGPTVPRFWSLSTLVQGISDIDNISLIASGFSSHSLNHPPSDARNMDLNLKDCPGLWKNSFVFPIPTSLYLLWF